MRRITKVLQVAVVTSAFLTLSIATSFEQSIVRAETSVAPSLVIAQLKVTSSNGQYVTLFNTTASYLDMSKYQLQYFNNYDLAKATSSKLVALSGIVPPHGYFMVSDASVRLCYQLVVDSASLDFSSTAGLVEVLGYNQASAGGVVSATLQDYVGWSKTAVSGVQMLPSLTAASLLRQPLDESGNPAVATPGSGTWQAVQPDATNPCQLVTVSSKPQAVDAGPVELLPSVEPSATVLPADASPAGPSLPSRDIGLMSPSITEILPNPMGTGTDSTAEFIEIYNPNPVAFDLSGFGLQVGTTTLHTYRVPDGTLLEPGSFTPFYASQTGLAMSNSGSHVALLDPLGNSLGTVDAYPAAKDGQAWALAKGSWQWTTQPTPGSGNVIKVPSVVKAKSTASKAVAATAQTSKTAAATAATVAGGLKNAAEQVTPIHRWILALIASLALLYGGYEYRTDLAHYVRKLGRNLGFGRTHWRAAQRRRGLRIGGRFGRRQNGLRAGAGDRDGQ